VKPGQRTDGHCPPRDVGVQVAQALHLVPMRWTTRSSVRVVESMATSSRRNASKRSSPSPDFNCGVEGVSWADPPPLSPRQMKAASR